MKYAPKKTGLWACSLSFVFAAGAALAQTSTAPRLDLSDRTLFPPEFFPNLEEVAEEELLIAGLREVYPNRILTELPHSTLPEAAPPVVRPIEPGGVYIRVIHLGEALPVIRENLSRPLVVLDLRFLTADLESTLALGSLLTRQQALQLRRTGDYPVAQEYLSGETVEVRGENVRRQNQTVFTLSNHETRGPIEALLAQLRDDGEIISVGTPTPGETAAFRPFPGFESFYIMSGELRPSDGASLAESGFAPRVQVRVSPDEDEIGYRSLREGISLDDLVQTRVNKPRPQENALDDADPLPLLRDELDDDEPSLPQDIVLQRTLNIVKALQALGKIAG